MFSFWITLLSLPIFVDERPLPFSNQVLAGNLQQYSSEILDQATATVNKVLNESQELMAQFGVAGIDFQDIAMLMSFNEEAIVKLAEKWSINPSIVRLLLAAAHRDEKKVLDALENLCVSANVHFPRPIISAVVNLAKAGSYTSNSSDAISLKEKAQAGFDFGAR